MCNFELIIIIIIIITIIIIIIIITIIIIIIIIITIINTNYYILFNQRSALCEPPRRCTNPNPQRIDCGRPPANLRKATNAHKISLLVRLDTHN